MGTCALCEQSSIPFEEVEFHYIMEHPIQLIKSKSDFKKNYEGFSEEHFISSLIKIVLPSDPPPPNVNQAVLPSAPPIVTQPHSEPIPGTSRSGRSSRSSRRTSTPSQPPAKRRRSYSPISLDSSIDLSSTFEEKKSEQSEQEANILENE